jgi:hypothetical protein
LAAGVIALGAPATARAETTGAEREAQTRFEEGLARVKAGNYEGARVSFTQAYAVLHKPHILWNLALAEEKSGHALDAIAHFKQFASGVPGSDDRASAEKHIGELAGQIGRLEVVAAVGAQVVVDGAPAGIAPLGDPIDVAPGHHRVEARTAQETKEAEADVGPGQLVHVGLSAAEPASAPTSVSPGPPVSTPSGPHSLAVLPADSPYTEPAPSEPLSAPRVISVVAVGTAAGVSLALGIYFGLQSHSDKDTADGFRNMYGTMACSGGSSMAASATCASWNDAVQSQNRDANLSNAFYVAAGVFGVGAFATWFLWPRQSGPKAAAQLTPMVGPAEIGVAGRF